jgi:hypothetical protein
MFRLVAQVPIFNSHAPFDGPPDGFAGNGIGTLLHRTLNVMKAVYSFAVQGGAVSTLSLLDDLGNAAVLPPGAVIFESFSNWTTAGATSASGTIALGTGAATNDLKTATAAASMTGVVAGIPVCTAASAIVLGSTTTGYQMSLTIATGAITAGVAGIYVWYVL